MGRGVGSLLSLYSLIAGSSHRGEAGARARVCVCTPQSVSDLSPDTAHSLQISSANHVKGMGRAALWMYWNSEVNKTAAKSFYPRSQPHFFLCFQHPGKKMKKPCCKFELQNCHQLCFCLLVTWVMLSPSRVVTSPNLRMICHKG